MYKHSTLIRVRYAETDQMQVVYYGNYPQYFEVGRVEALRDLGITYRQLEESGIMMPVLSLEIKYLRPALYDDLLTVDTYIKNLPQGRIVFDHEVKNKQGVLLTVGRVQLAFINSASGKPCRCPRELLNTLETFFEA